ncbi:MAG: hypothetical protein GF344_20835 [Chitinivibrionales bacterium]|nr:hypothetical protein [Chitinivibrionales bacterium]MBD3359043.1 hypothetical protein [Chitinivibrionales bacterium]
MNSNFKGEERRPEEQDVGGRSNPEVSQTAGSREHGGDGKHRDTAGVGEEAKKKTHEAVEKARERGRGFVGERQRTAAEEICKYGDALHEAARKLREDKAILAEGADKAAEQLDKASHYMKEHSPDDIFRSVNGYARKHPGVVWGSMLFAGFAFSRFFKASEHPRHSDITQ